MQCKKCGGFVKEGEKFCGNCGERVISTDSGLNINELIVNNQNTPIEHPNSVDTNKSIVVEQPISSNLIDNNENNVSNDKKNNRKSFSKILFFVIIVLLFIGGIFYFINQNNNKIFNKLDDSRLEENNTDIADDNVDFYNKLNESIYDNVEQSDLNLLNNYELSETYNKLYRNRMTINYSTEKYYEAVLKGYPINKAVKLDINNGELLFSEVEVTSDNLLFNADKSITTEKHSFYDCDKVKCNTQKINLNDEKAKYLSVSSPFEKNINAIYIMVLTEQNNIYEGIIENNNCESLACQFDIKLTKVNSEYKFSKIAQIPTSAYMNLISYSNYEEIVTNYGLTTTGKLLVVNDYKTDNISRIPLFRDSYSMNTIDSKSYQYFVYENGAIELSNNSFVLKDNSKVLLAKEIFEGTDKLYILGIDDYLYSIDFSNYNGNSSDTIVAMKYMDKKVVNIEYSYQDNFESSNVKSMSLRKMYVAASQNLYVSINFEDGTTEVFKIGPKTTGFGGNRKYIMLFNKK